MFRFFRRLWQVIWAPGVLSHPAFAFIVLILGGYLLAQLFGPILGAQLGYRRGSRKRDQMWARHIADRGGSEAQHPTRLA